MGYGIWGMSLKVGRVTPCAPFWSRSISFNIRGAQGTARPTSAPQTVWMFLLAIILGGCHYLDALPGRGHAVVPVATVVSVSTGKQLFDHHFELVGLEMMQLNGAGRTFGSANAAAHALGGFDLALAVLVAVGRGIGADGDAGHAGDPLLLVHVRNLGADIELRLGQDRGRPGGSGARMQDVFIN